MNEKLFKNNPKLQVIDLNDNICISQHATGLQEVKSLLPEITAKCGLDESTAQFLSSEKSVGEYKLGNNCGRVSYPSSRVIGGNQIVRGKWPFLVALISASNGKFFCAGNLISSKHVLTAAHCLNGKHHKESDVAVLLGQYDLVSRYEPGSERREVTKIIKHPNWKNLNTKYDYDLGILVLDREVQFSKYIQPICLTRDPAVMDRIEGTVVS